MSTHAREGQGSALGLSPSKSTEVNLGGKSAVSRGWSDHKRIPYSSIPSLKKIPRTGKAKTPYGKPA